MHPSNFKPIQWTLALVLGTLLIATVPAPSRPAAAASTAQSSGLVCTSDPNATFTLTARDGYISLPDGNTVYMWGFAEGNGTFQHPGPVLCVNQGDTVTVVLTNTLPDDVSIIFPGQQDVRANGTPAQPQFTGGLLTSLTNVAARNGGSVTYSFVAAEPGTYLYESGTDAARQVQMGLFGALIVRPAGHADWAYNDPTTAFNPDTEYLMLLSEIDPNLHQAVERGQAYDPNMYRARYFLINGRSFPDTIAPNYASWLPDQPYGALAHIHPYDPANNPKPALVRYLSTGNHSYLFHPHGNHGRLIARDGRLLQGTNGEDRSFEQFTVKIGPGQTQDALFTWRDAEQWNPTTNPIPVTVPQDQNLVFGQYYGGSPYLGNQGALPVGTESNNQCGEYYHVAHNHALEAITAWGITMSGMLTYTRIDPPLPNSCP